MDEENVSLPSNRCIATSGKKLLVTKGIATSNKGIARSKDATRGSWHRYESIFFQPFGRTQMPRSPPIRSVDTNERFQLRSKH